MLLGLFNNHLLLQYFSATSSRLTFFFFFRWATGCTRLSICTARVESAPGQHKAETQKSNTTTAAQQQQQRPRRRRDGGLLLLLLLVLISLFCVFLKTKNSCFVLSTQLLRDVGRAFRMLLYIDWCTTMLSRHRSSTPWNLARGHKNRLQKSVYMEDWLWTAVDQNVFLLFTHDVLLVPSSLPPFPINPKS